MNSTRDNDDDKSFESTNRTILLISIVTMLVITIVIILLHFYSRYLRRRQLQEIIQRRSGSALYNVTTEVEVERNDSTSTGQTGLDPSTIQSLPSFIYKPASEPMDCAVCLGNLVEDNVIKMLPNCKHEFHVECIDKWLESSISCPVCRTMAKPAKDERKESTVGEDASANQLERETESGGSRGSSFRKMFSRGRSSRRIQSVGDVDEIGTEDLDLERQVNRL